MRKTVAWIICLMACWPRFAAAQPLFTTEHDWTVDVGGATFGMRQIALQSTPKKNEFQYTIIYPGLSPFILRVRAPHILIGIGAIVVFFVVMEVLRRTHWRWSVDRILENES